MQKITFLFNIPSEYLLTARTDVFVQVEASSVIRKTSTMEKVREYIKSNVLPLEVKESISHTKFFEIVYKQ